MIECIIDGQRAIPSQKNSIKLVLENPGVRNKNSYTYDIKFPLDIYENLMLFSALFRQDISVKKREYEVCRLIVGNKEVFSGKGIITAVKEREVNMQIVCEVDATGIPTAAADVWIDQIEYPAVNSRFIQTVVNEENDHLDAYMELTSEDLNDEDRFMGEEGKYVFALAHDAEQANTPDGFVNDIAILFSDEWEGAKYGLLFLAVQPNLIYVLRRVINALGYVADLSEINVFPWNELYIASTTLSTNIRDALPHWTAKTLMEEIQKFFNASFVFSNGVCSIKKKKESSIDKAITIELEEGHEKNYDEDGLEYEEYDNVEYELSDSHEATATVALDVLTHFKLRKYRNFGLMYNAYRTATAKEKAECLWCCEDQPWLYYKSNENNSDNDDLGSLQRLGWFRPLYRDKTKDDCRTLKITPVATALANRLDDDENYQYPLIYFRGVPAPAPDTIVVPYSNIREAIISRKEIRESITVADVIEDGVEVKNEESDEPLQVMFASPKTRLLQRFRVVIIQHAMFVGIHRDIEPTFYVQGGLTFGYERNDMLISLSLNSYHGGICPGDFLVVKTNEENSLQKHEELIGKFVYEDGIPPVNVIYIIGNKRYIVKQLEMQVNEDGIEKMITGHFYELS